MTYNKKKNNENARQWGKFIVVTVLYLLFLYWLKSWLGLIVLPFIFDAYITKKIKWQWWKDADGPVRFIMSWVDAIVFALVAVYFINLFFFQNYVIPSSSLEKSLLTGDYLREQGKLWSAHTRNAVDNASDAAHAAGVRVQVVHRLASLGLPTGKRSGQGGT